MGCSVSPTVSPGAAPRREGLPGGAGMTWVAILLLGLSPLPSRGAGVVDQADTAALVAALQGGGLVQLTFAETLTLETPLLIASDTVLDGQRAGGRVAIVSGGNAHRIFRVLPGVRFEVRNCVLRDGRSTQGAAIHNQGILIASNVTFTGSQAIGTDGLAGEPGSDRAGIGDDGGDGTSGQEASGGAIFNAGEARFTDCLFSGNHATGGHGGVGGDGGIGGILNGVGGQGGDGAPAYGGAVSSSGDLLVRRCLFTANSAAGGDGGEGGSVTAVQRGGQGGEGARAAGGAIHSAGWLRVDDSAFATNLVTGGTSAAAAAPGVNIGKDGGPGGDAFGGAIASWLQGAIVNSTFFTNLVAGGNGGNGASGTFIAGDGGDGGNGVGAAIHGMGTLGITNVTLAANSGAGGTAGTAGSGGFGRSGDPGRLAGSLAATGSGTVVTVINSIVATPTPPTVHGSVTDAGHNLFTDRGTGRAVPGSLYDTDPELGFYQVWTEGLPGLMPAQGSPVIDVADAGAAPDADQRGVERPSGLGPDLGALEADGEQPPGFIDGQVLDGEVGLPGVRVRVGELEQLTDDEGRFRFGPLPAGFYTVELENDGVGFEPRAVQLALDETSAEIEFRAVALTLTATRDVDSGVWVFRAQGIPGRTYRLEGGPVLGEWESLVSVAADSQGRVVVTHDPGPAAAWFYRLSAP